MITPSILKRAIVLIAILQMQKQRPRGTAHPSPHTWPRTHRMNPTFLPTPPLPACAPHRHHRAATQRGKKQKGIRNNEARVSPPHAVMKTSNASQENGACPRLKSSRTAPESSLDLSAAPGTFPNKTNCSFLITCQFLENSVPVKTAK